MFQNICHRKNFNQKGSGSIDVQFKKNIKMFFEITQKQIQIKFVL